MSESTTRLGLPYIVPGQAQKELFHNEALALIDAAVAPAVEGVSADPQQAAQEGQCWIVAPGATGVWSGRSDSLACRTASGWRFVLPVPGMLVWNKSVQLWTYWTGSAWSGGELPVSALIVQGKQVVGARLPSVPSPSGGTTIDAECRTAVAALIATFKSHGLTD